MRFYSHGKLLISGEYLVLDGALSFAIPTKYGQSLTVKRISSKLLIWKSYEVHQGCWFRVVFGLDNLEILSFDSAVETGNSIAKKLQKILEEAKQLNPDFLNGVEGFEVTTALNFQKEWGLGTSSTLINNIASWAGINAFELSRKTFEGSAYDIACAQYAYPIFYQKRELLPEIRPAVLNFPFDSKIFFVHLNRKQDTRKAIEIYKSSKMDKQSYVHQISELTRQLVAVRTLENFEKIMEKHEGILSEILKIVPVKQKLFPDYEGTMKSLGAWGGDFIMATGRGEVSKLYFRERGYQTIIDYRNMIIPQNSSSSGSSNLSE